MKYPVYVESDIIFNQQNELTEAVKPLERSYSNMKNTYLNEKLREQLEQNSNDIVYRFYDFAVSETPGDLVFGTSIVYLGKVGKEFHITNGHYHSVLDTAEVCYCLAGRVLVLIENPDGDFLCKEMSKGQVVYVLRNYANRSINLSTTKSLGRYFVFRADAEHDDEPICKKGFRNILVECNGRSQLLPLHFPV